MTRMEIGSLVSRRNTDDSLYLLVDPLAQCDVHHPLHVSALIEAFDGAWARVPRTDLAHTPLACPLLVRLAGPGEQPSERWLHLSARYAQEDAAYRKRYIGGWLISAEAPEMVAKQLAIACLLPRRGGPPRFLPLYEPVRLELLAHTLQGDIRSWLWPLRLWCHPSSSGGLNLLEGEPGEAGPNLLAAADVQAQVPLVNALLAAWRHSLQGEQRYGLWRWDGDELLPPAAAVLAYQQISQARSMGLTEETDILVLALHRLTLHPLLHQHPLVRDAVVRAVHRKASLAAIFQTYDDSVWKRVVDSLMQENKL